MAEGGPSLFKSHRGTRRGRKAVIKEQENPMVPKIIIKKRPPRRPKLPNGEPVPCVKFSQVTENVEDALGNLEDKFIQSVDMVTNFSRMDQTIDQAKQQLSLLQLSEESFMINNSASESNPGTPEKSVIKKRTRSRRKNRCPAQNTQFNSTEASGKSELSDNEESSKSDTKKKVYDKKREKEDVHTRYIDKRTRDNIQKTTSLENNKSEKDKAKKKKGKKMFSEHLPIDVVRKIIAVQEPNNLNLIEGSIRINPRCYQNAYVTLANDQDILIIGLKDRNRALEGDSVAVLINPQEKWFQLTEDTYQKTGTVVSILEKVHPRKAVGFLKKQDVFVFLQPRDTRIPILKINPKTVPRNFYDNPDLFKETLFLCNIVNWKKVAFAEGEIEQIVGVKGDLSVETNAILLENDLNLIPFEDELLKDLPPPDFNPTESDFEGREDFRKTCVFTIDPATAVDLDDALSCKPLENGNYEVGIHIADVTHFLQASTPLDERVADRATTVYMVDNVYHMLPHQLCLACSLLPGKDKLAFSVILEMTPEAEVVSYRFTKSVINSCCQMSYGQAQIMIDDEMYDWSNDDSLKIKGDYKPIDLVRVVRNLYSLSRHMNKRRFDTGALKIDQPKLCVFLDKETKLPVSYKLEERQESNSLIEEFMLAANMTVAKHLYETFPEVSLLRSHPEPSMRILSKTRDLLIKFGVLLDVESSGTLYNSLMMYQVEPKEEPSDNTNVALYRMMVINSLCAKSMTRAVYKCSSSAKTKDALRHYALNAEFYTHFTSPIRRYPDCIVHRLLYASITNQEVPTNWDSQICTKVASNCNTKKYSAKMAQEQSNALYFTYMLDLRGSMNVLAIVMDVKERSADAMLCETGLKIRIYFSDTCEETKSDFTMEQEVPTVKITWIERQIVQVINLFSIVHLKITKHPQLFRLQGIILPPVNIQESIQEK